MTLISISLILLFTTLAHAHTVDRVAAVAGGRVIFLSEVEERVAPFLRLIQEKDVLARARAESKTFHDMCELMVDEALVEQEAERVSLTVTPAEVDAGIASVAKEHGLPVAGVIALARDQGWDEPAYRAAVRLQLLQDKILLLRHADLSNPQAALDKLHADLRGHAYVEVRVAS